MRVLHCCEVGREQAVFKWSSETGVHWLNHMRNEEGTHLRDETYDRLISNASRPHEAEGGTTHKVLCWILSEVVSAGTKTYGQKLKKPLGPWHRRIQHIGYEGSFVEATMSGMPRRLIEVVSTQVGDSLSQTIIRG